MDANITLKFDKLKEVQVEEIGELIELDTKYSVIANDVVIYEEEHQGITMHDHMFKDKKEFDSIIIHFSKEIKAIVKALNKLNIHSDVILEITNIDTDVFVPPSDLS